MTRIKIILGIIILLIVGIIAWNFPAKVYLVDSKTNKPVANHYVEIEYKPECAESPCIDEIIYSGTTGNDGSLSISLKDALGVNKVDTGLDFKYAYWVNTSGFERDWANKLNSEGSNIIYLKENV